MSALDVSALVIAWAALLMIVGRERIRDVLNDLRTTKPEQPACRCGGTGTVLADGPCDAAPVEVPCSCQSMPSYRARLLSSYRACEDLWALPAREPRRLA